MQRKIEVGLGKKEEATPVASKAVFEHKAHVVGKIVKETAVIGVFGVCAYVVLDAARQIAVERFS